MYIIHGILFKDERRAKNVLTDAKRVAMQYGYVLLADIYDLAERYSTYGHNAVSWPNLTAAKIIKSRKGKRYMLMLPPYKIEG